MSTHAAADPSWAASDLLEHARTLTALAAGPAPWDADEGALVSGVRELHARCVRLEIDPVVAQVPSRQRARLAEAFDRLAGASDDLASIVLLRCTDDGGAPDGSTPDLPALLERVAERHDHVIALLGRADVRRTHPTS
ncbi:hypothetical protein [Patulibacter sp.]|uniref:hypothetical protein n=1 Tax=Patulibacter sp. TaxID=1912859 RepID=UPI0027283C77|nr:hypothetical protein [Patulibacter sp.]MDO9408599.1 hypothetical protein [Patulibacter sp.]